MCNPQWFLYMWTVEIKAGLFREVQRFPHKAKSLMVVREGIPITVITYHCLFACFLSVVIAMTEKLRSALLVNF